MTFFITLEYISTENDGTLFLMQFIDCKFLLRIAWSICVVCCFHKFTFTISYFTISINRTPFSNNFHSTTFKQMAPALCCVKFFSGASICCSYCGKFIGACRYARNQWRKWFYVLIKWISMITKETKTFMIKIPWATFEMGRFWLGLEFCKSIIQGFLNKSKRRSNKN